MKKYLFFILCVVLFGTLIFRGVSLLYEKNTDDLVVAFLDVGQGDAMFVETPSGKQVLIDGGSHALVLKRLTPFMGFFDRSLDMVIATHGDLDHIGGLIDVFKRYRVDLFGTTRVEPFTMPFHTFKQAVIDEGSMILYADRGQIIDLGDGVFINILFPDRNFSPSDINAASIIMRLEYGETSFLLTGDAPASIEEYVVALEGDNLKSTVLKVGHHGSRTSSSEEFIKTVSPDYAIISAGRDNQYGHPHESVLDTLGQYVPTTLGTVEEGTIVFTSDGKEVVWEGDEKKRFSLW